MAAIGEDGDYRWRRRRSRGGEEVVVAGRGWRWPAAGEGGEDEWVKWRR